MTDGSTPLAVSVAPLGSLGPTTALEIAHLAEELGFTSFWIPETSGPEAFSVLGAVTRLAPSLDLGTCILPIQLRTPTLFAMAAATLATLAPDREIVLGVGISTPAVVGRWHGVEYSARPIEQMREFVAAVRACLSGETVEFTGEHYRIPRFRLTMPPPARAPKLAIAALNPRMLRLAGEIGDGVVLGHMPVTHIPWAVARVREGGDATVYAAVHAAVCARELGADRVRRELFGYATSDAYARSFERAGFAAVVAKVRERHAAGDRAGALEAVTDEMIDAMAVIGDARAVRNRLDDYVAAGVDVPLLSPDPWGPEPLTTVRRTLEAVAARP